jgi:hypothetical protein
LGLSELTVTRTIQSMEICLSFGKILREEGAGESCDVLSPASVGMV